MTDSETHTLHEPPKPVGWWILHAKTSVCVSFAMYRKPSLVQRWFATLLLGWTWEDAE